MNVIDTHPFHKYFIGFFIIISILFIILRILIINFTLPYLIEISRDVDFNILIRGLNNGIINFYKPIEMPPGIPEWPPYYLYFWYYIFYPMGLLPFEVGVYIWDLLRLIIVSFVVYKSFNYFKNKKDLFIFYILLSIGFCIDAWFNNVNFLILFFLYYSYIALNNGDKWLSGIFFTFSTFKINSLLFLPLLLLVRKIKIKELFYYILPFTIICIPYMIFPNYFLQMISNWLSSQETLQGFSILDSILWKALQPSHLMFISVFYIILFENLMEFNKKNLLRAIILLLLVIYYIYLSLVSWILPSLFS